MKQLAPSRQIEIVTAIDRVRKHIRWKPDRAISHLQKRKRRGHLPETAVLADYERIISQALEDRSAQLYSYWYNRIPYVTIVSVIHGKHWLIMFSTDGILETAFVVERPELYLNNHGFELIGKLGEVDNEL